MASSQTKNIVVLPGDGVGPEVIAEALKVLKTIERVRPNVSFNVNTFMIGGEAIDATGSPLPDDTLKAAKAADAILLGAVGGPKWGTGPIRPEQGLLRIRKELDVFSNIRPCNFASESLLDFSPLREEVAKGTDFTVVRELVGGIYFGEKIEDDGSGHVVARDMMPYSKAEIERITRVAAFLAMKQNPPARIHSLDKANVLATSRLWRKTVTQVLSKEFPQVKFDHLLIDSAAMLVIKNPRALNGIILTENMFGDIISDEASVIPGSLGLLPSASLSGIPDGKSRTNGIYEPIHGSAPDIAGKGIVNPVAAILSVAMMLRYSLGLANEAQAIEDAVRKTIDSQELCGEGIRTKDIGGQSSTSEVGNTICTVLETYLEGLNSAERVDIKVPRELTSSRPAGRRPMTITEKIIAHAAINLPPPGNVKPGDMVCVHVDWTLASELTWKGMEKTYDQMKRPKIHRNDRFWLAIDHTVDPRTYHLPKTKSLVEASLSFSKEAKLVDYLRPNTSILHTEFYRQRAQPGQVIIGADSHSCSAGGLGAFAVGLGAADVVMPLVTGETWFSVPETCEIKFIGEPPFGIGGKDTILYVLGELKRNTVAFERSVEFTGPGLKHLSCDARFAIANMSTEFGGIAGVVEADEITAAYISKRTNLAHKNNAIYFRADPDAEYAVSYTIDLSNVESLVAVYPSPDNVVSVDEAADTPLDGCFIGACTTAEEDLILGALVLEAGLKNGMVPISTGQRRVTPGSLPILAKLRKLGLLAVYERAGFTVGAPGCSYCLGIAADIAGEGEVWLSSQNRNFKNRMGKGSIGNLASAATVAASSFNMKIANPRVLLDSIDRARYSRIREAWSEGNLPKITISEPMPTPVENAKLEDVVDSIQKVSDGETKQKRVISGKVQRFEENVDTDAIIPAPFMPGKDDQDLGTHCFEYYRPEFRQRVKDGATIVVAGNGFGSGSSREEAPRALMGIGVQCVIAPGYAFIYGRNQLNMGLLGIIIKDEEFYELSKEGAVVSIDQDNLVVTVQGFDKKFTFKLTDFEQKLISGGGVTALYDKFENQLFRSLLRPDDSQIQGGCGNEVETSKSGDGCGDTKQTLAW
ncbi:putative aconitate hydratase [Neolecta irregularis DAH-3]|uniref:3-isopropylmalate dehydrogenase n=1 Tax=Neolecta irregularis (strain DAH-3) TaxID=1198029 RepID=A0A1U7LNM2_NEOID|nr:putative aconitate hydratase [Neolecta irregularis DAH-3]|eukprot:OLL24270.1 putative aconitate hydratase [Neolecta irregularis DAH-3]